MEERENDPDGKGIRDNGRWKFKGETPFEFNRKVKVNKNRFRERV